MTTKKQSITLKEQETNLPAEAKNFFDLNENMEGVEPRLPEIGIAHQAQLFKMPDETKVQEITGIILHTGRVNAYWKKSFDEAGGGHPPDCSSLDAVTPADTSLASSCAKCKFNRFGSDGKRGKICKNMRRIHIQLEGNLLPYRVVVPPSSLRSWDEFATLLTNDGRPYQTVITRIKLQKEKNHEGIEYSSIIFEKAEEIQDMKLLKKIKSLCEKLGEQMKTEEIISDEYEGKKEPTDEDVF